MKRYYKYHCWNCECRAYAGYGYIIKSLAPLKTCPHCGHPALEDLTGDPPAWSYSIAFGMGGLIVGLVLESWKAGLIGVVVGLMLSLFFYPEERVPPPPKEKK